MLQDVFEGKGKKEKKMKQKGVEPNIPKVDVEGSQSHEGMFRHLMDKVYRREIGQALKKKAFTTTSMFFIVIFIGAFMVFHYIDISTFTGSSFQKTFIISRSRTQQPKRTHFLLKCARENTTQTCPTNNQTAYKTHESSAEACPQYFQWIHEDLRPWKDHGISRDMVESAKRSADFRIVIVNGRVYMEKYKRVFQTRDVFTIWGILQLLRLYPGKLPDLDLMFLCSDRPAIRKRDYSGEKITKAPPLFHYCGDDSTLDIAFPDWSFWGWPEINIEPWELLGGQLEEGNHRTQWVEREPYAYWKGNVRVGRARKGLIRCNGTDEPNWNARIFALNWSHESQQGFHATKLTSQCTHRYMIYVEGNAWSVSEKYILACDSMSFLITPQYYDFFTRSLLPMIHYWPIKANDICRSIKFAVDWGNSHTEKAQEIGKAGSKFIQENLKMKHVYDYMFHLISAYAELLIYKPSVPPGAIEVCLETMACNAKGLAKKFLIDSIVESSANTSPCIMPLASHRPNLQDFLERKENLTKQADMWGESEKS